MLFGRHEWNVRSKVARRQKEWSLLLGKPLEQPNRLRCGLAVSLVLVAAVHVEPAHRKAERRTRAAREDVDLVLFIFVATARIDRQVPRIRIIHSAATDLARDALVV